MSEETVVVALQTNSLVDPNLGVDFECVICKNIAYDAVECITCDVMCCRKCI